MKKILLFSLSTIIGFGALAQRNNATMMLKPMPNKLKANEAVDANPNLKNGMKPHSTNGKKTRATSRWYSYVSALDTLNGGNGTVINNIKGQRIWQDSTVKQLFTSGAGTINYSSYYNVLDPMAPAFNDVFNYPDQMQIGPTNTYTVDTVVVWGSYLRPKGGNPDTLIISLVKGSATAANNDILYYNPGKTSFPEMLTNNYVTGIGADTMMVLPTLDPDITKRIAKNKNQSYVFKKVLTDADTSSFVTPYDFAIPTALAGEAGEMVGVSVTYKSGNPWIANVDTVSKLNNFLGIYSEHTAGAAQPYYGNSPDFDLNMSGSMFSFAPEDYFPSFFIEGWNSTAVGTEIAWIDYHLNCTTCGTVGVNDVKNKEVNASVFPNPATSNVTFEINLTNSAKNVTIELTNTVGQLAKHVNVGAINSGDAHTVDMNVTGLPKGIYFYTINADGQTYSNKLMIK